MADSNKILGQLDSPATTLTDLYTVPADTQTVGSSLVICNRGVDPVTIRVAVSPDGEADDPKHYLYYDLAIPAKDTFIATIGMTLNVDDVVRVYSSDNTVSFNLFGVEVTA